MLDESDALKEAIEAEAHADCEHDEANYVTGDVDKCEEIMPTRSGKDKDAARARRMLREMQKAVNFLRSRLRNIVRAAEQVGEEHGLRRGRKISDRTLVDSRACLRAGRMPDRAYMDVDEEIDTSLDAVTVIDGSSSMSSWRRLAGQIVMAINEPLDSIGCGTQVVGFRDGPYRYFQQASDVEKEMAHKAGESIYSAETAIIDIFKHWEERFKQVEWRFANTKAEGCTPMASGLQFAINSISHRRAGHRVIFVVTDGCPTGGYEVIRRQLRLCKEAGVHVIGVGIGRSASYVKGLFVDHVWHENVEELPRLLVAKLNQLCDFRAPNRGRRIRGT